MIDFELSLVWRGTENVVEVCNGMDQPVDIALGRVSLRKHQSNILLHRKILLS
jgi:hypothetical protein